MKLLVTTQAVDRTDPTLGFFHRWLVQLAGHFDEIDVICLKEGEHELPPNVRVHSLGKELGRSKVGYVLSFYRYVFSLRYGAVFVHMNEEYVLLAGLWWRLLGKRVILWRNHKMGTILTRAAVALASGVCHTSPDAFVAFSKKAARMPIGIDTSFFTPPSELPDRRSVLFLGRVDPVKKIEAFIEALKIVTSPVSAHLYGSPTDPNSAYAKHIREEGAALVARGVLSFHPSVTNEKTRELYRSHSLYVNLTPSGSFDKTIGEAMACGCVVICSNRALRGAIKDSFIVKEDDAGSVARAIDEALLLSEGERAVQGKRARLFIEENHSLERLAVALETFISQPR